jgi:hypothetical protein
MLCSGQELPTPPALRHGEPCPGRVRPRARPPVEPAGPRRPRAGVVEVLPLRAAAGARRRRRRLHLRRRLRFPAAVPPHGPHGRRQRPVLRRRLPRHHHQEGLGEAGPGAGPPAGPQRAGRQVPLPRRHAGHPRHRGRGGRAALPRLAGGPLAGVGDHDAGRQDPGQGGRRRPAYVPLQRAVRVGARGADRGPAGEAGHPHRQQLRHRGRGGAPAGGWRRRARRVVRGAGGVGAEPVREPGGPHQRGVRGVLRPPQEDGGYRGRRSGEAGDEELGQGPAARHRQGGRRVRAAAPVPVGRADGEPRAVAGLQDGARDPPVVAARPGAGVHRALLQLIVTSVPFELEILQSMELLN